MNKVISREYVEKNYIHKDKIKVLLDDYIYGDAFELAEDNVKVEMILSYLEAVLDERDLLEETKDENNNTTIMQKQKEQSADINK